MTVDQKAQVANAREEKQMSNENETKTEVAEVLKTPEEWCQIEGVQILDADGWRGRDGRDWTDPISLAEFRERLATCTLRSVAHMIDADQIIAGGSIITPSGWAIGATIDPVLTAGPPRYRLWDGAHHFDEIEAHWTRDAAIAMARGLASFSRNTVRLVEITETATEINLDEETAR